MVVGVTGLAGLFATTWITLTAVMDCHSGTALVITRLQNSAGLAVWDKHQKLKHVHKRVSIVIHVLEISLAFE